MNMIQQIILNMYNPSKSKLKNFNIIKLSQIFSFSAYTSYSECEKITKRLLEQNEIQDNKILSDFILKANNNFTRKTKAMKILRNLSELNNERIVLKDSNDKIEHVEDTDKKNEKKKNTLIGNTSLNGQLSLIKEDSFEDNSGVNEEKKELEISIVGKEKLETKKKNVSEIQSLIQKCDEDIINLNQVIKKYQYATKDLIMKSEIIDNNSMIFINKKEDENEENDDMDKKAEYFKEVKNEFCILKRKLENLLSLYQLEKELTEIKKNNLENLEELNNKYNEIKRKKYIRK